MSNESGPEFEDLIENYLDQLRSGSAQSVEEFADSWPEHAEQLRELLPTLVAMEDLAPNSESFDIAAQEAEVERFGNTDFRQLGDYRIIREIGRGGMGIVYEAEQMSLHRRVALKVLPSGGLDERFAERFQREARAAAKLHHTNIVPVYDVGEQDGTLFYAMQFISGAGLDSVIKELRRLRSGISPAGGSDNETAAGSVTAIVSDSFSDSAAAPLSYSGGTDLMATSVHFCKQVARLGIQVAEALDYAHRQGVLHRDIKPANLLLDAAGNAWITDFGLAQVDDARNITQSGDIIGTLRYMPPESFRHETDKRSEVYALGVTLYEMLALRPAFEEVNRYRLIHSVSNSSPQALRSLEPGVPFDLETILSKAFDREPKSRYQSAEDFAADLRRFVNDEPIQARRLTILERFVRWRRHNAALANSLLGVALLVTLLALVSTIAATRLSGLNEELGQSVADLTTARNDADSARKKAEVTAEENLKLATEANVARQNSIDSLAAMYQQRGFIAGDQGEPSAAALWFAHAAELTPHDSNAQQANWLRARNWLENSPQPVAAIHLKGDSIQPKFQPSGGSAQSHGQLLTTLVHGWLRLWDWEIEECIWHRESVSRYCWSPDGSRIAVGCKDGGLEIYDVTSKERLWREVVKGTIHQIRWSSNRLIAVAADKASLWEVNDSLTLRRQFSQPEDPQYVAFNQAGSRLAVTSTKRKVLLFDTSQGAGGEAVFEEKEHTTSGPMPAVFSMGGKALATIQTDEPVWLDITNGKDVTPNLRTESPAFVLDLKASRDESWVAAGGRLSAMLWNSKGRTYQIQHTNNVRRVEFSPDSSLLATYCIDGHVRFWRLPNEGTDTNRDLIVQPAFSIAEDAWPSLHFSDDGRHFLISGKSRVTVWEIPQNRFVFRQLPEGQLRARFSPDGKLATFGKNWAPNAELTTSKSLTVIEAETGEAAAESFKLPAAIVDSCFCADSKTLAVVCGQEATGQLLRFNVETGQQIGETLTLPERPVTVDAHPKDTTLAIVCRNGQLLTVDASTGEQLFETRIPRWKRQLRNAGARYSPDGTSLAVLTPDRDVHVFDVKTMSRRFPSFNPLPHGGGHCRSIDFSHDGRFLATTCSGTNVVEVWNVTTGKKEGTPLHHAGQVYGLSHMQFSPNDQYIATGHTDGMVRIWDWRSGELVVPPMEHDNTVNDVAFTADGRHLLSTIRLGTVWVWDAATGDRIAPSALLPSSDLGCSSVVISGSRAITTTKRSFFLLDLDVILREPTVPVKDLESLTQLSSFRRMELGRPSRLRQKDWDQLWTENGSRDTRRQQVIGQLAQRVRLATTSKSKTLAAKRAVKSGVINELAELYPAQPEILCELARYRDQNGDTDAAQKHRDKAIAFLQLKARDAAEDDEIRLLADLLFDRSASKNVTKAIKDLNVVRGVKDITSDVILAAAWLSCGELERASEALDAVTSDESSTNSGITMLLKAMLAQHLTETESQSPETTLKVQEVASRLKEHELPSSVAPLATNVLTTSGVFSLAEARRFFVHKAMLRDLAKLTREVEERPRDGEARKRRAAGYTRFGMWDEAISDTTKWKELAPNNRFAWARTAELTLLSGDVDAWKKQCQQMARRFRKTTDPPTADSVCKACLLHAGAVAIDDLPTDVVFQAASRKGYFDHWFKACCALICLRSDDVSKSLEWAQKVFNHPEKRAAALAHAVAAMAHHNKGDHHNAAESLKAAEALIPKDLRELGTEKWSGRIPLPSGSAEADWFVAEILRQEAARLIREE